MPVSLTLEICLLLAVAQGLCWLMARGLGTRLPRRVMALGIALPLLFLSPFLVDRDNLLAPTGVLAHVVPGSDLPRLRSTHLIQSDALYQFLPWELEVRHALRAHRLPLWSDLLDGGSSPWINPQAGVLSPLAMLARVVPIQYFLLALLAMKMLVAGEGAWLLARHAGISRAASWLVAAGFTLGGGMMSWALFPHTTTLAWVPWLALGCIRLFRRPRRWIVATTAAITAAMLVSGHPETAAAGGLLAAACGLGLRRRGAGLGAGLAASSAAALLGFALAAPLLLPFACALPAAQRTRDMLALRQPLHNARLLSPPSWLTPAKAAFFLAPLNPEVYGIPYQEPFSGPEDWVDALSGYAGLVAFAGGMVALAASSGRRARRARPWLGYVILSLLLTSGFVPFALLVERVAVLRVPIYTRMLPVATLALAVAGGLGLDQLLRQRLPAAARWRALLGLGLAAAASLAAARSPHVLLLWGVLAAAALLALWKRPLAGALLALALGLDLVPWAQRLLPHGQAALFYPANPLTEAVARETGAASTSAKLGAGRTPAPAAPAMSAAAGRAVGQAMLVYPQLLPVYGIAEVRANNVLAPASYLRVLRTAFGFDPSAATYYSSFGNLDHPLLSFLAVRAVIGNLYLPRPRTLVAIDDPRLLPFLLYRNPRALPRWFVPLAVEVIDREGLDGWVARLADARCVALFRDEVAGSPLPAGGTAAFGAGAGLAARVLAAEPGRTALAVPGRGARLLATSIPGPSGWRAQGGGRLLTELTVDGAFLGVLVPAAVTRVELSYRPPGLLTGTVLASLALLAMLALVLAPPARPWASRSTMEGPCNPSLHPRPRANARR